MQLPERDQLEIELLKRKNETYKFVNGLLASTYIAIICYGIYRLVGAIN